MTFNPSDYLMNMSGKDYLEVKWRIVWFRDAHPRGSITTELASSEPVVMKATITDETGHILATGYGTPKTRGVAASRPFEGAETAAIGRALAVAGFGTQFTGEEEGEHLADSPIEKPARQKATKSKGPAADENENAPAISPQFLVDNELSSNIPHAAAIVNGLKLGGKPATKENLAMIEEYRKLREDGKGEKEAFELALKG